MNKNRIVNVSEPVDPNDAATKLYVDDRIPKVKYKRILKEYAPTFWLSNKFGYGFDDAESAVQDLTGNSLTITNTVNKDLKFGLTSGIVSTSTYGTTFTFFLKAKLIGGTKGGSVFTGPEGHRLFGWWTGSQRAAYMGANVFGL